MFPLGVVLFPRPLLVNLGHLIVFEKADFEKVDAVVVLAGNIPDRGLQAADLLLQSRADLALLSHAKLSRQKKMLWELGIFWPQAGEINRLILLKSGVEPDRIRDLPGRVDSTWDEAQSLRAYLQEHPLKSIAIVTCKYHFLPRLSKL